jgi:hypothetical protein
MNTVVGYLNDEVRFSMLQVIYIYYCPDYKNTLNHTALQITQFVPTSISETREEIIRR